MSKTVAIIGGGAAGLAAAIGAARDGAEVSILEAKESVGKKILETGNGRCNFSHADVKPSDYNAPEFVKPVLAKYGSVAISTFFSELGLLYYTDSEGRLYPTTNSATSVLEALRLECAHLGIKERCNFKVIDVRPRVKPIASAPPFTCVAQSGTWLAADAVVLATGSDLQLVPYLGITKVKSRPVLCPLHTTIDRIKELNGIRVRCGVRLLDGDRVAASETGELLFRDYGVSGIVIFDISRFAEPGYKLSIDFFPQLSESELERHLKRRIIDFSWRRPQDMLAGMLDSRIAKVIFRTTPCNAEALTTALKDFRVDIISIGDARTTPQVMRGGAKLAEFDNVTLASTTVPGLFSAGEVLNIDGRCGGYNLHWAWASGLTAGRCAASETLPFQQRLQF